MFWKSKQFNGLDHRVIKAVGFAGGGTTGLQNSCAK
jgi:hypothetical protein